MPRCRMREALRIRLLFPRYSSSHGPESEVAVVLQHTCDKEPEARGEPANTGLLLSPFFSCFCFALVSIWPPLQDIRQHFLFTGHIQLVCASAWGFAVRHLPISQNGFLCARVCVSAALPLNLRLLCLQGDVQLFCFSCLAPNVDHSSHGSCDISLAH